MPRQVTYPTHPSQAETLWQELIEARQYANRLQVEKLKLEGLLRRCRFPIQWDAAHGVEGMNVLLAEIRQALGEGGQP